MKISCIYLCSASPSSWISSVKSSLSCSGSEPGRLPGYSQSKSSPSKSNLKRCTSATSTWSFQDLNQAIYNIHCRPKKNFITIIWTTWLYNLSNIWTQLSTKIFLLAGSSAIWTRPRILLMFFLMWWNMKITSDHIPDPEFHPPMDNKVLSLEFFCFRLLNLVHNRLMFSLLLWYIRWHWIVTCLL